MNHSLSALIVDDERLARRELISLLAEHPEIRVIGEADDVPSAVEALNRLKPDVMFLDIQMPGQSGFDLLEQNPVSAHIVFVTAYDEYALRAFEVNALDYLMKPVNPARLQKTVERLFTHPGEPMQGDQHPLSYGDQLFLMYNTQMRFLRVDEIVHITSAGDYTEVHLCSGSKGLTVKPMREWETRLPSHDFCRIHRSTIINLNHVDRVERSTSGSFHVYLKGQKEPMVISRRFASRLRERLK